MSAQIYDEKEHQKAISACLDRANDLAQSRVGRPTMNDLKPVVIFKGVRHNSRTEIWGFLSSPDVAPQANTDLYAIPDTHRVVSVELLRDVLSYCSVNQLSQELRAIELRAIIDNKEQKE